MKSCKLRNIGQLRAATIDIPTKCLVVVVLDGKPYPIEGFYLESMKIDGVGDQKHNWPTRLILSCTSTGEKT